MNSPSTYTCARPSASPSYPSTPTAHASVADTTETPVNDVDAEVGGFGLGINDDAIPSRCSMNGLLKSWTPDPHRPDVVGAGVRPRRRRMRRPGSASAHPSASTSCRPSAAPADRRSRRRPRRRRRRTPPTPERTPAGDVTALHTEPFQCSISVPASTSSPPTVSVPLDRRRRRTACRSSRGRRRPRRSTRCRSSARSTPSPSGVVRSLPRRRSRRARATPKSSPEPEGDCSAHDDPFHISIRGCEPAVPTRVLDRPDVRGVGGGEPPRESVAVGARVRRGDRCLHPDPSRCAARVSFPRCAGSESDRLRCCVEAIAATLGKAQWSPPPRLSTMLHPVAVAAPLAGEPISPRASDAVRRTAPSAAPQERFTGQSSERRHSVRKL